MAVAIALAPWLHYYGLDAQVWFTVIVTAVLSALVAAILGFTAYLPLRFESIFVVALGPSGP